MIGVLCETMPLSIQELLDRSRKELLDLSTRNRLLSIPVNSKSARIIQVHDELLLWAGPDGIGADAGTAAREAGKMGIRLHGFLVPNPSMTERSFSAPSKPALR